MFEDLTFDQMMDYYDERSIDVATMMVRRDSWMDDLGSFEDAYGKEDEEP